MSFNVRTNPPRRSRREIIDKCNVGFTDEYKLCTGVIGQSLADRKESLRKYRDGWDKIFGKKE